MTHDDPFTADLVTNLPLQPDALERGTRPSLRVAVLGTCVAESFSAPALVAGWTVDHYLAKAGRTDPLPAICWENYDAVLVHTTIRNLLHDATTPVDDYFFHVRDAFAYDDIVARSSDNLRHFLQRINATTAGNVPLFILAFPEPPQTFTGILVNGRRRSFHHFVRTLNDVMAEAIEQMRGTYFVEVNDLLRSIGDAQVSDVHILHLAHLAYGASAQAKLFLRAVLRRISDALYILQAEQPVKLIITDLDNTLWMGVLAEEDDIVPHRHHGGWPLGYAEALLEFKRRGGLLAICSKNDHEKTLPQFRTVWTNRITFEDFCSVKINRRAKFANIAEILEETNLLPASVLFIDDDLREIAEVQQAFPDMRFLSGAQEAWRSIILYSAQTQVAAISAEAHSRTGLVRALAQRQTLAREVDREQFLLSLQMRVSLDIIKDAAQPQFDRALELLNRSNQFNTTGQRWTAAQLAQALGDGAKILALSAQDVFADNGLVALAVFKANAITQVVMSCRVFGLGLESALLHAVIKHIHADSAGQSNEAITGAWFDTGRNRSSALLFAENGFVQQSGSPLQVWELKTLPAWPHWLLGR